MEYCGQYNLKNHSTLKIGPVNAKVVYVDKDEDIATAVELAKKDNLVLYPLGGGSNTIFSDSVVDKYLFMISRMSKIEVLPRSTLGKDFQGSTLETVTVKIDAGLEWDKAVEQTVETGLSGLEALSFIPGLTGACPVQNIGAYGTEAKDTIWIVHTYDMQKKKFLDFKNENCEFEYRNSIFKKNPGRYFIYAVTFSLLKITTRARLSVPQYKDVISYFETNNNNVPTLKKIREAIIEIRKNKLPNPALVPNAGSYFGNPIILKEKADDLLQKFPEMPMFDFEENKKLFAGWLIDKAGLKGFEMKNFSIHKNHALVIIGNGKGTLSELLEFENLIKQKVFEMFGVELEREPILVE